MFRKAQAAMEFLMTYGWAILVVLVAIGALAYFGVLSPDNFLPKKCTVSPGIACTDHKLVRNAAAADTSVQVVLRNGMGSDLTSVAVKLEGCTAALTGATTIANGDQQTYTQTGAVCAFTSTKYTGQFNVTYNIGAGGIQHNDVGSVTTKTE